ncbi:hypothetical protein [Fulvivirga ligni]|uniref:hypothetical protein n=1 Tax=Fulvivirga ligni TaxID=2904246 RepID=UPI001F2E465F|nr:hypothetical protein [Fulvivirga ligni]UII20096.1 hypothetical protein LVD16_19815 [Fulvivirga ligni]
MKFNLSFLMIFLIASAGYTQDSDNDLATIDGTIKELLDQITIEPGEKMDTAAIRSLFHPSAILTVADSSNAETVSLNDFLVLLKDPYYEEGYTEREIYNTVDEYKGVAHVFQSFYGKDSEGQEERGMNSYQLTYYQGQWRIVSLLWCVEPEGYPIPAKYLGK